MPYNYTDGEIIYLKYIAKGKTVHEIVEIFNKCFGTNLTYSQIRSCMNNHGIRTGIDRKILNKQISKKKYTQEHLEFLKNHIKGRSKKDLVEMLNNHFNTDYTESIIKGIIDRNKLTSGLDCRFKKGIIPVNKGKKGMPSHPNMISTQFKKGQRPQNYMPVGSERVTTDGYVDIKVADPNKWRRKHHIVWEKHNGSIPQGYAVIFANGDKHNFDIDNLLLVTRKQLFIMNQNGLIKNDIELTKIGLSIANLHAKIKESEKKMKDL